MVSTVSVTGRPSREGWLPIWFNRLEVVWESLPFIQDVDLIEYFRTRVEETLIEPMKVDIVGLTIYDPATRMISVPADRYLSVSLVVELTGKHYYGLANAREIAWDEGMDIPPAHCQEFGLDDIINEDPVIGDKALCESLVAFGGLQIDGRVWQWNEINWVDGDGDDVWRFSLRNEDEARGTTVTEQSILERLASAPRHQEAWSSDDEGPVSGVGEAQDYDSFGPLSFEEIEAIRSRGR